MKNGIVDYFLYKEHRLCRDNVYVFSLLLIFRKEDCFPQGKDRRISERE